MFGEVARTSVRRFDLDDLVGGNRLEVTTAGGGRLSVRVPGTSRPIYIENRAAVTHVDVQDVVSVLGRYERYENATRTVEVGEFWQYDEDRMSHRVTAIEVVTEHYVGYMPLTNNPYVAAIMNNRSRY